jgi:Uma2 family endonuclease
LNIELDANGAIVLNAPVGCAHALINVELLAQVYQWNQILPDKGFVFGPSAGFTLSNGAVRSPDVSWVVADRWNALSDEETESFAPICPLFVLELMSPTDHLKSMIVKMEEYIASGAKPGWLIHRKRRLVYVFRPGKPMETLDATKNISGDPELPGFMLSMERIF